MDVLGLGNLKGGTPQEVNKGGGREERFSSKERPIYSLKGEAETQVYNEGLTVKLGTPLAQVERLYIENTLSRHKGDREKAARTLNLDKGTLTKKMNRYGL